MTDVHRYYKRRWEERRGDQFSDWGEATYYFEIDEAGYAIRQIETYANGRTLRYDRDRREDKFGSLADQPLDSGEFRAFEIAGDEFERAWAD